MQWAKTWTKYDNVSRAFTCIAILRAKLNIKLSMCYIYSSGAEYFLKILHIFTNFLQPGASCSFIFFFYLTDWKEVVSFQVLILFRISRICVNCMCFVRVYLFYLSVCVSSEFMCFVFVFHLSLCVSSEFMGFHTIFMCQLYV